MTLMNFTGNKISPLGQVEIEVQYNQVFKKLNFVCVIRGNSVQLLG